VGHAPHPTSFGAIPSEQQCGLLLAGPEAMQQVVALPQVSLAQLLGLAGSAQLLELLRLRLGGKR